MLQLRNRTCPGAQGFSCPEGSISKGAMASRRGTGGVAGCSALEEDDLVTCDPLDRPWVQAPVVRGPGDQPSHALAVDESTVGRPGQSPREEQALAPKVGTLKRGVEAASTRQGSRTGACERKARGERQGKQPGEGRGSPTRNSKGTRRRTELQEGNMTRSEDREPPCHRHF
jgi:hypothetical protein